MDNQDKNIPQYGDSQNIHPDIQQHIQEQVQQQVQQQLQQLQQQQVQQPQQLVLTQPTSIKEKIVVFLLVIILGGLACVYFGNEIYNFFNKPSIYTEKDKVDTPEEAKKVVKDKTGYNIDNYQAKGIANSMHDSDPTASNYKKPDSVVNTNGKDYKNIVESERKKSNSDIAIVTPKNPNMKVSDIKNTDTIVLEQRNYKLYPDRLLSVTAYNDASVAVDYQKQVKVFNKVAYVGPSVMLDRKYSDVKVGVKLTIPF